MSQPNETEAAGRGALRRQARREDQHREEAIRWWTKPGVLLFLGAFGLAAVGWGLLVRVAHRMPVQEATFDGLELRLTDATWILDQMDHGENFQKPAAMMPDMPQSGFQRVTMYMAFENHAQEPRDYHGEEFFLVPEIGAEVPPFGAVLGEARLEPGQRVNTALHFDLDTRKPHGRLLVEWRHGRRSAFFPVPEPAEHYHLRPRAGDDDLPADARLLLPIGKVDRGERLYAETYGCVACHGDPRVAGSNNIGPHLGGIGALAGQRVKGLSAEQYLYDSIVRPSAFIAPECKGGKPCESPSTMPEYASLVTLADAADLLAYLRNLKGG